MASKSLFQSASPVKSAHNTVNDAGGTAFAFGAKHALAQAVCTGTFADSYYVTAENQLERLKALTDKLTGPAGERFLAQLAVYGAVSGKMKDAPSALLAILFGRKSVYTASVFDKIVRNGKMLRNFVQMVRSGQFGRKSLGSQGKRLIANWFNTKSDKTILNASVGNTPSLSDILALAHVKPLTPERAALYGYLRGKQVAREALPAIVREFEEWKQDMQADKALSIPVPDVEFRLLTGLPLTDDHWKQIALRAPWNMIRQNLATFARHGVFKDKQAVAAIAARLQEDERIATTASLPYTLFTTYRAVINNTEVPPEITLALQLAAEQATANVVSFGQPVEVIVDVSGSMQSPITGNRGSATSSTTCLDAASFIAATIARRNPGTRITPVCTHVHKTQINPLDSIMTIASLLAKTPGGGTDLGKAIEHLNQIGSTSKVVILLSDNESWMHKYGAATLSSQWKRYQARVPGAKLVCIDLVANETTQVTDSNSTLNIGGWSDEMFTTINDFLSGQKTDWVTKIEQTEV